MKELLEQILAEVKELKFEQQFLEYNQQEILQHLDEVEGRQRKTASFIRDILHYQKCINTKLDSLTLNAASQEHTNDLTKS